MISETVFRDLVGDLPQANTAKRTEFWKHVANIANNESPMREYLETVMTDKNFNKQFKADITSSDTDLRCGVILAAGYCVARPQLARHLDIKSVVDQMMKVARLSSFNKQITIKCVWAVSNVKESEALKELSEDVMALICDLVKHKFLKDDVAVHKEILRLLDKMLQTAPKTSCQFTYLARWLVCVVNLTVSKLQVIREKAGGLLEKHMGVLLSETDGEVNRIIAQQLFSLSTVSTIAKPTSWLLQELQQLANTGHSVYVIKVWVSLVHMTSKLILKRAAYLNELFSVPDFFIKHLTDSESRIALFDSWIQVIDIYKSNIPEFFANSKHMKFFMTPFFAIKQPSLEVSLALVKSWWYLVVACHRLKYMNTFSAVLEPCMRTCFKLQEAGALVQRGADILYLLLDCSPPQCDLTSIAPSSLNLSDSIHCTTFLKYYEILIRYKPKSKGLIIPIWSRLCDCSKGVPDSRSMISVLQTAATSLYPISVLSMIESLSQSQILPTLQKVQLASLVLQCTNKDDKMLSVHLTKLLKTVPFEDNQYLKFLNDILGMISEKGDREEVSVQNKLSVWESVCTALAEYAEQTGGQLNEGTRINPEFSTTHNTVIYVFTLFIKSHNISQTSIQSVCQKWEKLVSLYIEHTSQYCSVNVTEQLISHILDTYLDSIQLYPLIYCSKVLVEESPVPQLTLLQTNSSPVFKLVSSVLDLVYNETKSTELPLPTLTLCIELCTASWNLLTPGKVISILTQIRNSYLGLITADKQYPTSLQNIIQTSYISLLSSVQKHLTFYNDPELECLEDYLIYGLKHSKRIVRVETAKFWNNSFGIKHSGPYSDKLRVVIQQEAKRSALIVPSGVNLTVERTHSQSTEMSDPTSKSMQVPVKGSFLNRKKDINIEVDDPKPSTKVKETYAKSSKRSTTIPRVATPPRTRSVYKRQVAEESQDCIYISSSPKKQKILTKHQKEKQIEQRLDRDVPVMYNSLDLNSQEPFLFDTNSQSQALPSQPTTPEKAPSPPPVKPPTAGFSSKKLLFLSPLPNKANNSEANQSIKNIKAASLPLTSPDIPSSQSDQNNSPSDSEEDLYCDPPEEPQSVPTEPSEPIITPPHADVQLPDSGIELQHSQLQLSQLDAQVAVNDSFTPDDGSRSGRLSNVLKSMISYVVPGMVKPTTLDIAPNSDTDKSDDNGSQISTTTASEAKTSAETTPMDTKSISDVSIETSDTSPKTTPLVPPESLIEGDKETPIDTSVEPLVFVEDSQSSTSENTVVTGLGTTIPDSVVTPDNENVETPNLQQFSHEISFSDCSTARESTSKLSNAGEKDDTDKTVNRRSSRRLIKRIKSEDLGVKESPSKFKRVKSSDDMVSTSVDHKKLMTPIKESEEFTQLRISVRPRKSSVKLRDESFINTHVPASILNTPSKDVTTSDPNVKTIGLSLDSKVADSKTPKAGNAVKKKRGRPRKNVLEASSLESPRKKVTNSSKDLEVSESIPIVTIPDSQSDSSQSSVVCLGELTVGAEQSGSKQTRSRVVIPDTPVTESAPLQEKVSDPDTSDDKKNSNEITSPDLISESVVDLQQISPGEDTIKSVPDSQAVPENQTSIPDSQKSIADSQTSIPDSQTSIPGRQKSIADSQTSIPDSQTSIPDSQKSLPGDQTSVQTNTSDSQHGVPDSQPMIPQPSITPKKKRGRPPKKHKKVEPENESVKTPTLSQLKSRKSPRLSATPPDSKNLITAYLSKSSKPSKTSSKDSDSNVSPATDVKPPSDKVDTLNVVQPAAEVSSVSQESEKSTLEPAPLGVQNDSESLTQSLAPNFQLTEEESSLDLELLPLPSPSQEISPQETESIPSLSSSQRRSRKQNRPKKSAAPVRSRKSLRLTTKAQALENKDKEGENKDPDIVKDTLSENSPILELQSQVVPDSLLPLQEESKKSTDDNTIIGETQEQPQKELNEKTSDEVESEPMSETLSLDVSSSDKRNLLSSEPKTPEKATDTQSPGYTHSPESVDSVEVFGKPVEKVEFTAMPCTPLPGQDTLEDSAENQPENLVKDTLEEQEVDSLIDPVIDTFEFEDSVKETLQEPAGETSPDLCAKVLTDESDSENKVSVNEVADSLADTDTQAQIKEPVSPYKELEEFPETETSVTFCSNSQIPSSQEETCGEANQNFIPDSQTVSENAAYLAESRTARSLKRKPSIPSNLPDVMQDLVAVELSMAEKMEVEAKTPPKSLQLGAAGEPNTPTTPKTPSSILKRRDEPGSGSPSLSKRHVTFGPLPEPHRDPNEVTPRRHSKYNRKSPAPPQPKFKQPEPNSNEEPVFPSLVHSTVRAHDIIRTLCTGFTLSQRNYNLSIVSSTIKTIGDLAKLTPSQIEEYPFITPKLIQVRRNLKKFEASQSPMWSVKSFLSETRVREAGQKSESDSLPSVPEEAGSSSKSKEVTLTSGGSVSERRDYEEQEGKENVADCLTRKEEDVEPIATELDLEDEDKENRDPNDKPASDKVIKTESIEQTKSPVEVTEILSSQTTEESVVSDPVDAADDSKVEPESLFNRNSVLPTTDVLNSDVKDESHVTVIQNSLSTESAIRAPEVITVGLSKTDSKTEVISPPDSGEESAEKESTPENEEVLKNTQDEPEADPEIEITDKSLSSTETSESTTSACSSSEQASGSTESGESHPPATVICEDSPEDSLGLTCHEELSLSCEMNKNIDLDCVTVLVPETTSESSQSISQDIARPISEVHKESEVELQGKIVESQDEAMEVEDNNKPDSSETDSTTTSEPSSICSLIRDIPGLGSSQNTGKGKISFSKTKNDDASTSDDVSSLGEVTNPLVDYPLTQPPPLVDYPLTQEVNTPSFEEEIRSIEEKLARVADPLKRLSLRHKLTARLLLNGP